MRGVHNRSEFIRAAILSALLLRQGLVSLEEVRPVRHRLLRLQAVTGDADDDRLVPGDNSLLDELFGAGHGHTAGGLRKDALGAGKKADRLTLGGGGLDHVIGRAGAAGAALGRSSRRRPRPAACRG